MLLLILGLAIFFATHLLRVFAPAFRERMIDKLGPWGWKGVYSLVAIAGFVMFVIGYAEARWQGPLLWGPAPGWTRMAVGLLMLPVLVVFFAAYLPGKIRASLRHPMVIATAIWAAAHLVVNGRLADLLLFGGFLGWSMLLLAASFSRRAPSPGRPPALAWDGVAIVVGALAWWWLAFGGGHLMLFGMPVM